MSRRRKRFKSSATPASARDADIAQAQPPLFTRIEAMVNLALRTVVPVVGVLFLGYDAKQLAALYFVDTWLSLATLFGLLIFQYLPIPREGDISWADRINGYAGYWLFGIFAASCAMTAAAFPMFFVLSWADVRTMANDQTFLGTLASHLVASLLAFTQQSRSTRVDDSTRLRIRHRIDFAFLRWIGVYALVMAATQLGFALGTFGPLGDRMLAMVLVICYAALTVAAELYPEETRRMMARSRARS
jgi:hypothetical protein